MTLLRQRMIEDMHIRNLAPATQKIYVGCVARFAQYFGQSPDQLGREHIREYMRYLVEQKGASASYHAQVASALRFLYHRTLRVDWPIEHIPSPRREQRLPVVLSREEIVRFLGAICNLKYRLVFLIAYSAGLRVSEITHLQVQDIDRERMVIHVCVQRPKSSTHSDGSRAPIPRQVEHLIPMASRALSHRRRNGARDGSEWCSRSVVAMGHGASSAG